MMEELSDLFESDEGRGDRFRPGAPRAPRFSLRRPAASASARQRGASAE